MKNKMKTCFKIKNCLFILLALASLAGCDNYERIGVVTPEITVNKRSLNLWVGETAQLIASPTINTFTWTSEDAEVATVDDNGLVLATGDGETTIVVRSGDAVRRVPVTTATRRALTDFILSVNAIEMRTIGMTQPVTVTLVPSDANNVLSVAWQSLDTDVATVADNGEITSVGEGLTEVRCTINEIVKSVRVEVWITKPFNGPHILSAAAPYTLKSVDFDIGGLNYAYFDTSTGNLAGYAGTNYRIQGGDNNSMDVDIQADMASIGYNAAGEWLLYTVEVTDAGNYLVSVEAAVDGAAPTRIRIEIDNVNATGTVTLPSTGGWGAWQWLNVTQPISLTKGKHKIKFFMEAANFNLRNLRFTYQP